MAAQGARRFTRNILAGGTSGNIIAGDPLEYPGQPSQVQVAIAGDAVGLNATVRFGNEVVFGPDGSIAAERVAGAGPLIPDNIIVEDVLASSDRLSIELSNPTAGALDGVVWLSVKPV